tara:strand:+ start:320 stop:463 length:144 start_codon:yes stop_codon:yes gene_type:complete
MDEKFTSNNIQNDKAPLNSADTDYKNLIIRLKDISERIALLEKTIFR